MADVKSMKQDKADIEEEFGKFTVEATNLRENLKQQTAEVNSRLNLIATRQAQLQGQVQLLDSMIKAESKGKLKDPKPDKAKK